MEATAYEQIIVSTVSECKAAVHEQAVHEQEIVSAIREHEIKATV